MRRQSAPAVRSARKPRRPVEQPDERFRLMADAAPLMIWLSDAAGHRTWFNKAWLNFTGRHLSDAVEDAWIGAVHPEDVQKCRIAALQSPDGTRITEYRLRRGDGEYALVSEHAAPLFSSSGVYTGAVGTCVDLTAHKEAEAERGRILDVERAARSEADRANHLNDDFVAMVSHELRTPLNAILGWTQLMMRTPDDPAIIARGLDVVARNTRTQAQLISDLLDISRIVSGKLSLEIQPVDIAAIVREGLETIREEASAKGVTVTGRIAPDLEPVAGDPARLQQVVWNLVSNAVKFTPRDGHVRVALDPSESGVTLTVSDDGAGIRSEFLPHVFERFHQADRSITRRFGGLGVGLSIVKHLVELHGGTVRADSSGEGRGATFTVDLPANASGAALERATATPPIEIPQATISLGGLRLLIVEDEPDTREFLKRLLESHGASVVEASTAGEALARFRSAAPDVLISDIGLPRVDGYELIRKIRRAGSDQGGGIPAIALTAYSRSEDRTRAFRSGYNAHVGKPVEPSELVATIASLAGLVGGRV